MLACFKGVKQDYVLFADTEYDQMKMLQFAGLLFKVVDKENFIFQLERTVNTYIRTNELSKYVSKYTGLSVEFLQENGVELEDFVDEYAELFSDIKPKQVLFVSHGTKNDRKVLKETGVKYSPGHSYCTYKNAKKLLKRDKNLTLSEVAATANYELNDSHNALNDAWATLAAFSYLKNVEYENKK